MTDAAPPDDAAVFAELREKFAWPAGKLVPAAEVPRWLGAIGGIAQRRGAQELFDLASLAVQDPDSPDRLYDLGYALIDAGAPALAASVLWRCLALVGDSEEVVCELVSALESALAYEDAFALLEEHRGLRARSFLARYLHGFNAAMTGRLDITRAAVPALGADSPESEAMVAALAGIVARADRLAGSSPLDARDLRGWHYVLSGGLLTHLSPYGFDAPMHGRYAWVSDSTSLCAFGLERLAALVQPLGLPCIYVASGRSSEIFATAAAARLNLPLAPFPALGVPAPGLVIAYDLAELTAPEVQALRERRPDQIFFAHATPWTIDRPVAPDVTTLLYQSLAAPWEKGIDREPDARPVDVIAAEVAAASPETVHEYDSGAADAPAAWAALVARAWPLDVGRRSRLWAGGPVPSSRFA